MSWSECCGCACINWSDIQCIENLHCRYCMLIIFWFLFSICEFLAKVNIEDFLKGINLILSNTFIEKSVLKYMCLFFIFI